MDMLGQPYGPDASPIVERLRDARYIGQEGMRAEAADQIERLRRENEQLLAIFRGIHLVVSGALEKASR